MYTSVVNLSVFIASEALHYSPSQGLGLTYGFVPFVNPTYNIYDQSHPYIIMHTQAYYRTV